LTEDLVYDTYPQVVAKLKEFLTQDGVTNKMMCKVLGGISHPTLTKFLSETYLQNVGDKMYKAAYSFFEKLRILEKMDKSEHRLKNEMENSTGCHLYLLNMDECETDKLGEGLRQFIAETDKLEKVIINKVRVVQ